MKSAAPAAVLRWGLMLAIVGVLSSCATGDGEKTMEEQVTPSEDVAPPPEEVPMGDMDVPTTDEMTDVSNLKVYFAFDDYSLTPEAQTTLESVRQYLEDNGDLKLTLHGHCDERGTPEYNLALGQRRADAVKTHLMQFGIDEGRLATVSHGEENLVSSVHKDNRRVEFESQ